MTFPVVERAEVDSVPVLWAESPGPLTASLVFRIGRADEPLHMAGLAHLVEHLALSTLSDVTYPHNGAVALTHTAFVASGDQEDVRNFVRSVCMALTELPVERLEREKRVLMTEEFSRSSGFTEQLLSLRFGANRHGVVAFRELGLHRLDPDAVIEWARQWFVADNAYMWMTGPPPPDLHVDLPPGARRDPPPVIPARSIKPPAYIDNTRNIASGSMLARRTMAFRMGNVIAATRTQQRLRHEQGTIYDVEQTYDPLAADTVHATLGTSVLAEHAQDVSQELLDIFEEVAGEGATPSELARVRDNMRDSFSDPRAATLFLSSQVLDELLGRPSTSFEAILDEAEGVGAHEVSAAMSEGFQSLLMSVPEGVALSPRLPRLDPGTAPPVVGRRFRPHSIFLRRKMHLVIGDDGMTLTNDGDRVTVRFAECAAVVEKADGSMIVVGEGGDLIQIKPQDFVKGRDLRKELTSRIEQPLFVPLERAVSVRNIVQEIADRDNVRRSLVEKELDALPLCLDADEEPLVLAEAAHGWSHGLLAVTDRRLIFLNAPNVRERDPDVIRVARHDIVKVEMTDDRITVIRRGDDRLTFKDIAPQRRVNDIGRAFGYHAHPQQEQLLTWPEVRPLLLGGAGLFLSLGTFPSLLPALLGISGLADLWAGGNLARHAPWQKRLFHYLAAVLSVLAVVFTFISRAT